MQHVGKALSSSGDGSVAATSGPEAAAGHPADAAAPSTNQNRVGLRAGSVDDNARFTDYLAYRHAFADQHLAAHDFDVTERHVFTVATPSGSPVLGAVIKVKTTAGAPVAELRTFADGRALWFPKATKAGAANRFKVEVTKGHATKTITIDRASLDHAVTLDAPAAPARSLDVEFLVDATGSMGDEIAQLKASLSSISDRVRSLPSHPDVRFALTIFRDRGDDSLSRTWDFTADVAGFRRSIADIEATGGGDTPEDVQQGLHDALAKPSWRGADTVKLVFLVGDATPHLDYDHDPDYVDAIVTAAAEGIKIESLAASGLDDQGEYIWRQLAQATLGQFVFLTYGADDTTTNHVSGYTPDDLDDLVVRLISGELGGASPQGVTDPQGGKGSTQQ
jgi:hypothetical protein